MPRQLVWLGYFRDEPFLKNGWVSTVAEVRDRVGVQQCKLIGSEGWFDFVDGYCSTFQGDRQAEIMSPATEGDRMEGHLVEAMAVRIKASAVGSGMGQLNPISLREDGWEPNRLLRGTRVGSYLLVGWYHNQELQCRKLNLSEVDILWGA